MLRMSGPIISASRAISQGVVGALVLIREAPTIKLFSHDMAAQAGYLRPLFAVLNLVLCRTTSLYIILSSILITIYLFISDLRTISDEFYLLSYFIHIH